MKRWLRLARRHATRDRPGQAHPSDIDSIDPAFRMLADRVRTYTMTSDETMYALYGAMQYIVRAGIEGDVVECGVWRGGSAMLAALTLVQEADSERAIWLYDTFEGMPPPSELDVNRFGVQANDLLRTHERLPDARNIWAYATLADVKENIAQTGYPDVKYVEGRVEETIPTHAPERISLLRLDTDWYESTRHELEYLYPRLAPGGVLILDDYGWWTGARQAVDEYFAHDPILLVRIGFEGVRIATKPPSRPADS